MPKVVAENGKDVLEILKLYKIDAGLAPRVAEALRRGASITFPLTYPGEYDWGLSLTITPPSKAQRKREADRERRAYWAGQHGGDKKRRKQLTKEKA